MRLTFYAKFALFLMVFASHRGFALDPAAQQRPTYGVMYTAWIKAGEPVATVHIRLSKHPEWVRWMRFNADPTRYSDFKGSGELQIDGHSVLWRPPQQDAWLRYQVKLDSRRESGHYDGLVTDSWAMFLSLIHI